MAQFELTFRFDDEENSMSRHNGLPLEELADLLKALSKTVSSKKTEKIVLSEIKGNCYAPVISTESKTQFEAMKTLHTEISKKNILGLTHLEKAYYKKLRGIMKDSLSLNVYDHDKSFYKVIEKLEPVAGFPYFLQTNAYRGFLTRIGSRNLKSKNTILLDSYAHEIQINKVQDEKLREFYKDKLLEVYLTEKINKETNQVEKASLDDFKILDKSRVFLQKSDLIRQRQGDYFSDQFN